MQIHSTVLDQNIWGVHLNSEGNFASPPDCPAWLTQLQQHAWQRRGIVLWDTNLRVIANLYAGYAIELLENLQTAFQFKNLLVLYFLLSLKVRLVMPIGLQSGKQILLRMRCDLGFRIACATVKYSAAPGLRWAKKQLGNFYRVRAR